MICCRVQLVLLILCGIAISDSTSRYLTGDALRSKLHKRHTSAVPTTEINMDLTVFQIPMSGRADLTDIRDGYIVSPGYPGRYPQEADGRLGITTSTAAEKTWFTFTVEYLNVEEDSTYGSDKCYDYLTISFDGGDVEHEFCGRSRYHLPEPFMFRAKSAELRFKSDEINAYFGFKLHFHIVDNFPCGRTAVTPCLPTPSNNPQCVNTTDGQYALLHSHPWQAAVVSPTGHLRCAGVVLSPEWVAVAANCVKFGTQGAVIQSGSHNFTGALRNSSISRVVMHPHFTEGSYDYDIALLHLEQSLLFGEDVSAICLPGSLDFTGARASVTNWGSGDGHYTMNTVDRIRESQVIIATHTECSCRYGSTVVTDRMLCASSSSDNLCRSDSGGPLVVRGPDGSFMLAGISSVGMVCGSGDNMGIFTNITAVNDWLVDTMIV